MSQNKISPKDYLKDLNEILKTIDELNKENLSKKDILRVSKKTEIINKKIKNKYKNLDSKE